jgi:hypothetical protein
MRAARRLYPSSRTDFAPLHSLASPPAVRLTCPQRSPHCTSSLFNGRTHNRSCIHSAPCALSLHSVRRHCYSHRLCPSHAITAPHIARPTAPRKTFPSLMCYHHPLRTCAFTLPFARHLHATYTLRMSSLVHSLRSSRAVFAIRTLRASFAHRLRSSRPSLLHAHPLHPSSTLTTPCNLFTLFIQMNTRV